MARLTTKPNAQPVEVYALPTGQLSHPDRWIFEDGDEDWMKARHTYPDYSFLIRHHSGKNILFDLGLTKVRTLVTNVSPASVPFSKFQSLPMNGVKFQRLKRPTCLDPFRTQQNFRT